ncbi:MAG: hypothetical protein HRU78_10180 [Gammaproteobacteria bacterium]|nr:MAG: hypothetical protein HRU78_10180 [Gammaproteobacteria bacterium]
MNEVKINQRTGHCSKETPNRGEGFQVSEISHEETDCDEDAGKVQNEIFCASCQFLRNKRRMAQREARQC